MTTLSNPNARVTIVNANPPVGNTAQKMLIVGQEIIGGSATSGDLFENIGNDSTFWDNTFGARSMLSAMIRAARRENAVTQIDAIVLGNPGTPAQGTITVTGPATEDGVLTFTISSARDYVFSISVTNADTETAIAANIASAITANLNVPVTASSAVGVVTITADCAGTVGNFIGLSTDGAVAGVTVALVAIGTTTAGNTDPTLTGVFDIVGDRRYQGVVWPYENVTELTTFLDGRFNVDNIVLDGAGFVALDATTVNIHTTRLNLLNSENLVEICDKTEEATATYKAPAIFEWTVVKAAQVAAKRALRLTDDADISDIVLSSNGPLDAIGGPALASKPYFNTPYVNLPLIPTTFGWKGEEVKALLTAGGAVLGENTAGNMIVQGQTPTTYKTDVAGNPDITFKYLNYRDTSSGSREYFFNNLKARFGQSRLTAGDPQRGRDQVNDLTVIAAIEKFYQDLGGPDFVLVQSGPKEVKFFKDNLVVALDLAEGQVIVTMETPIVTQLRSIIATQKIAFSTEG